MTRTRQISQSLAGLAIAALGVTGLTATWAPPAATAQSAPGTHASMHASMHAMMSAMHGEEAVEQMHDVEGMERMMDQCSNMMNGMGGMMNGGGMENMMNGRARG